MSIGPVYFKKLFEAITTHAMIAALYGGFFSAQISDYFGSQTIWSKLALIIAALLTFTVAYRVELRTYYPFSKAIFVNLLALLLFIPVANFHFLSLPAFFIVLYLITYRCQNCIEFTRPEVNRER
jgi:hypothetical protein